jgi:ABC-type polysaccharide/polyol phosphate transport system ATPase subunit
VTEDRVVIKAVDLKKVYRLYSKPSYRFRDMFGMLGDKPGAYTEHSALDRVNLEIRRGEKVAIIGRNGAGKSTFLKLVTRVIEPTSGTLEVSGKIHALLQIGTGFHPDFTGRENVYAYFAQLGIGGEEADRRYNEVVEFAELEEYIDQPVKTYSTGMGVRLMFSASTVISPELLVLDEVLGVGDAYFAHKSYARIRELCEREHTTLLLVTHDVYSAVNICDRVIWIDRGQVLMDGGGPSVVKAYEDSVRQQEEHRLRLRKQASLRELARHAERAEWAHVLVEIASRGNKPLASPVYFSALGFEIDRVVAATIPLDRVATDDPAGSHVDEQTGCWGPPSEWQGRISRPFLNYGSSFRKATAVFAVPRSALRSQGTQAVAMSFWSDSPADLSVRCYLDGVAVEGEAPAPEAGRWVEFRSIVGRTERPSLSHTLNTSGIHGSGAIAIRSLAFEGWDGEETDSLVHGRPARLRIDYRVVDPAFDASVQAVVAFKKDGVHDVSRIIGRGLRLSAGRPLGSLTVSLPRVELTDGRYGVTVLIAADGYYDREQWQFFSINPEVYACASNALDVGVGGAGLVGSGTVSVSEGQWSSE